MIRETSSPGIKIYYEPHCDYDEKSTAPITDLDVVITPACSQLIAGYPLVRPSCVLLTAGAGSFWRCRTLHGGAVGVDASRACA